jgi:signal peptidase I
MIAVLGELWRRARGAGLLSFALIVFAAFSFRSAVADWHDVPTGSMQPTIAIGDRIVVNKLAYDLKIPFTGVRLATWGDPARGDIVICRSPADGARLVKRVVGVPGDVVAMRDGRLVINGVDVAYDPLPADELAPLMDRESAGARFLEEQLPGRSHVVTRLPRGGAVRNLPPVHVPEGQYLVMGDNRDRSADSRSFGFVPRGDVAGRVQAVAGSLDIRNGWKPRWERFFSRLD